MSALYHKISVIASSADGRLVLQANSALPPDVALKSGNTERKNILLIDPTSYQMLLELFGSI